LFSPLQPLLGVSYTIRHDLIIPHGQNARAAYEAHTA
jgi:hypothetical protein